MKNLNSNYPVDIIKSKRTFNGSNKLFTALKGMFCVLIFIILSFPAKSQIQLKTGKEIKRTLVSEKPIAEVPDWKKLREENAKIELGELTDYNYFVNNDNSKVKVIGIIARGSEFVNITDKGCYSSIKIKNVEKKDTAKNKIRYKLPDCIKEARGLNLMNINIADHRTYADRHPQQGQTAGALYLAGQIAKGRKTNIYPFIDGKLLDKRSIAGPFVMSPDMDHMAYLTIGKTDVIYDDLYPYVFFDTVKAVVNMDGVLGKKYDYIRGSSLSFSTDGKHLVYTALLQNNKWTVVYDGKELKEYDNISEIVFSPNSGHFVYAALNKDKWTIVYDRKEIKEYNNISSLTFSPDGEHFAYAASLNKDKWFVVIDGKESEEYKTVSWLTFSPDSKHLAYIANNGKYIFAVVDGKPQNINMYRDIYPLTFKFSPDGSRFSYCAQKGNKWIMVIDGVEQLENNGAPTASQFSSDGKNVYYIGAKNNNSFYFINNQSLGKVPDVSTIDVIFADDGLAFAYVWANRVVINGNKGEEYKHITKLKFQSNNEISYIGEKDGKLKYIVEKFE